MLNYWASSCYLNSWFGKGLLANTHGWESKNKTTFTISFELFEFEVMPFGLHYSAATFQWVINHVLGDYWSFARAYLDDIVVFSSSWEEHLHHLCQVLECLHKAQLTVKCQFGKNEVHYLAIYCNWRRNCETRPSETWGGEELSSPNNQKGGETIFRPLWLLTMVCATFNRVAKAKNPDKVKWSDQSPVWEVFL